MSLLSGMNKFLQSLEITFRRDSENLRPRINKKNSVKVRTLTVRIVLLDDNCIYRVYVIFSVQDVEQKRSGNYFFLDT